MNSDKRIARIVGILFIIGTVAGILSVLLGGALRDPNYLNAIAANEFQMRMSAFFVLIMAFALAMVPVVIFPVFKKNNEALALGYVVFRGGLETVTSMLFAISMLLMIPVSHDYVNAGVSEAANIQFMGTVLLSAWDQFSIIGTIVFSLGSLMFYYLWYASKLIPRWLSIWGFAGTVLYLAHGVLAMFDHGLEILMAPLAVAEMVLAVWLIVKGFDQNTLEST